MARTRANVGGDAGGVELPVSNAGLRVQAGSRRVLHTPTVCQMSGPIRHPSGNKRNLLLLRHISVKPNRTILKASVAKGVRAAPNKLVGWRVSGGFFGVAAGD